MDIVHHYIEAGAGHPLLLLHGNGEDCGYFVHQMGPFSEKYHVYAPDTRGHGQTPRGEAPFTIEQFAEDLLGFLDARGIEKAHILGFSDGGNIALTFALAHADRVDKLILNGANLNDRGVKRRVQIPIVLGYRAARLFAKKSPEARAHAEMLGLMVGQPDIDPAELTRVTAPTLVIAGRRDMIRESHTRQIAAAIPGAELAILPGDHFVANKNPADFNRTVLEFLER